jgi:hypothetical protein
MCGRHERTGTKIHSAGARRRVSILILPIPPPPRVSRTTLISLGISIVRVSRLVFRKKRSLNCFCVRKICFAKKVLRGKRVGVVRRGGAPSFVVCTAPESSSSTSSTRTSMIFFFFPMSSRHLSHDRAGVLLSSLLLFDVPFAKHFFSMSGTC